MKKGFKIIKPTFQLRRGIIIVLVIMIIGYASLVTVLDLTGNIKIGFKFDDVNIYIANLYSNNINKYNSISEDKMGFDLILENGTNNIDLYIANNTTQYEENITLKCNNAELNGVTITPNENNKNVIYSQLVLKNSFIINNTGGTQTLNCKLENKEIETSSKVEPKKKIIFAADGYENPTAYKYLESTTYGELPVLEKENYEFLGWYDINDNKIESTTEIQNLTDEILFAKFDLIQSKLFSYSNTKTNINCDNVQCAITELNEMVDKKS